MVKVTLASLKSYTCGMAGRARLFHALEADGVTKKVYTLTDKEWAIAEKEMFRGNPVFVRTDLPPTAPEESVPEGTGKEGVNA